LTISSFSLAENYSKNRKTKGKLLSFLKWCSYGQEKVIPSQYPDFPGEMVVLRPEETSVKQKYSPLGSFT